MIKRITLTLLLAIIFAFSANAQFTYYWRATPANTSFTNPNNWESVPGNGILVNGAFSPQSTDNVVFPNGHAAQNIVFGPSATCNNFTVGDGGTLTFQSGAITILGNFTSAANATLTPFFVFAPSVSNISFNGAGNYNIDMGDDLPHTIAGIPTNINFINGTSNFISAFNVPHAIVKITNSNFNTNSNHITLGLLDIASGTVPKTINFANSRLSIVGLALNNLINFNAAVTGANSTSYNFTGTDIDIIRNNGGAISIGPQSIGLSILGINSITFSGVSPESSLFNFVNVGSATNATFGVTNFLIDLPYFNFTSGSIIAPTLNLNIQNLTLLQPSSIKSLNNTILNLNINSIIESPICEGPSAITSVSTSPINLNATSAIVTNSIGFKGVTFSGAGVSMPIDKDLGFNTGAYITTAVTASKTFWWVGGTGNWNDPTKWSIIGSGGLAQTAAGCLPTLVDDVVFDNASFSAANQMVTLAGNGNTNAYCRNITWNDTEREGAINLGILNIYGSANFSSCVSINSPINYLGTLNHTVTSGTPTVVYNSTSINFLGSGVYTLNDNLITSGNTTLNLNAGTFNSNGNEITVNKLTSASLPFNNANLRNVNFANSIINITRADLNPVFAISTSYLTSFIATGSTFNLTGQGTVFAISKDNPLASVTLTDIFFNNINFTNTLGVGVLNSTGANLNANVVSFASDGDIANATVHPSTVDTYNFSPGRTYRFQFNATYNVTTAINTSLSDCAPFVTIRSINAGIRFNLNKTTAPFAINGAIVSGLNSTGQPLNVIGNDAGNNVNVNFTARAPRDFYWVGDTGNWSDPTHWSIGISGGNPLINNLSNCIPSSIDNVFFDADSFTSNSQTVTIDVDANVNNMTWTTSVPSAPILAGALTRNLNVYGSLNLAKGMISNYLGSIHMLGNNSLTANSQSITSNSVVLNSNINFSAGGRYDILDSLNTTGAINFSSGKFYSNGNAITAGIMSLNVNSGNTADISYSNILLTGNIFNFGVAFNATHDNAANWDATGSTITMKKQGLNIGNTVPVIYGNIIIQEAGHTIIGNQLVTFNDVDWQAASSTMNGNFNINNLKYQVSSNNIITASKTITVANNLIANGSPCAPIVFSTGSGSQATISSTLKNFDLKYARLTNIIAGNGTAAENKVIGDNVSGNSNWTFTPTLTANYLSAGIPDLNLKCNQYPYTLTTAGFNLGAVSYVWSDGSTGPDLIVAGPGTYTVNVTFGSGCILIDNITLGIKAAPILNAATLNTCETTLGLATADFTLTAANAQLVATPANYTFSYHASLADANAALNPLASPYNSASGTVYVRVVETATGCSSTKAVTLTVNAMPTVAAITGTDNACIGKTTQLANATAGGVWSSSATGVGTVDATGKVTGVSAGTTTITYTVTNASGCITAVTYDVTINTLPVVDIITGTNNACVGKTTQLANVTAGGVWSTSAAGTATVDASGLVTGVAAGAVTISYTVTNANGCITKIDYAVTINPLPVVAAITGTNNACIGATTQLANATAGGVWSTSDALIATVSNAGLVTGVAAGPVTISYTVTNGNGCETKIDYAVTINSLPVVAAITGTNNACVGKTTQLANATAGGVWSTSAAGTATVNASGLVTGVAAGAVTISYTVGSANCSTKVDYAITINPLPIVAAITGTNNTCVGKTTQLANVTAGGVWSTSAAGTATVDASGLVTGVAAGAVTISYTVTNVNGCITKIDYAVTINALPVVAAITGTNNACIGKTTQLANATAGGVWSTTDALIATVSNGGLVTGVAAGPVTISYTVTNGSGCDTKVDYAITINPLPVVAVITGANNACVGKTTQLANVTAGGAWSTSAAGTATVDASGLVTGVAAGPVTISYTVTNGNGCITKIDYSVTINPLPVVAAITGTNNACIGKTTQLANATAGGVWSTSDALVATVDATGLVTSVATGAVTISYTVTNLNGCITKIDYAVTINPLPVVAAITGTDNACIGKTTQLANATGGGVWSTSAAGIATVNASGLVTGVTDGAVTISYTVTNGSGCDTKVDYAVTINPLPVVVAITGTNNTCETRTTTLSNATAGGIWSTSNNAIATVDASGVVTGVTAGVVTISYTVTNGNGCSTKVNYPVTINTLAVVNPITGPSDICIGNTKQLSNLTAGGVWSTSDASIATVSGTGVVNGVTLGVVTISYTVGSGSCAVKVDKVVTINPLPVVAAIINSGGNLAEGTTRTLTNATAGGTWTSSNTGVATINVNTGEVTGIGVGLTNISYTVTNANGCSTTVSYPLTVGSLPGVDVITGPTNICVGFTAQLSNVTLGGVWSSSNPAIATVSNTGLVTGVSPGVVTISYTVTNAMGSTVVTYDITINAIPVVAPITGTNNACVGNNTQLFNTTPGGVWSSLNPTIATVNNTGLVIGVTPGLARISYTVIGAGGCSTIVFYDVTINAMPVVAPITGTATACEGKTTQLTTTTTGGVWSSSNPAVATVSSTGLVTGITAGTATISYTVTGTGGCITSVSYLITINALPTASISYSAAEYPAGGTTPVIQTGQTGGTYSSSPAGLSIDPITGTIDLGASTPNQTYTVTYTFSNGNCTGLVTTIVKVSSNPAIIKYDKAAYCALGKTKIIQTGPAGGVYTSNNAGLKIDAATGEVDLGLSTQGTYTVTYTYQNGSVSASTTTTIVVNPLPVLTLTPSIAGYLSNGGAVTITATGGLTYSWTGDNIISGQGTDVIKVTPNKRTTYTVTATNANGCTSVLSIVISDFKLIPNNVITPNGDGKNDVWVIENVGYYPQNTVTIYDRAGRKLFGTKGYLNNWDGTYNGSMLVEGAYVYVIDYGEGFGLIRGVVNIIRDRR